MKEIRGVGMMCFVCGHHYHSEEHRNQCINSPHSQKDDNE